VENKVGRSWCASNQAIGGQRVSLNFIQNMDEKYLWPLVGVALGWALSFFTSVLKDRAERKQKLGLLVSKLLHVHAQVLMLQHVSENFKDNMESWEEYEPMRKRTTQRHFLEPESHVASLREAIDDVSGLYPVEARSLHNLIDMLLKNKSASFTAASKSREIYIRMLSIYEVGIDGAEKTLRSYVRRFARRHGLWTFVSVHRELQLRKSSQHDKNVKFVEKFSAEMFESIREMQRVQPTAQSSASAPVPSEATANPIRKTQ